MTFRTKLFVVFTLALLFSVALVAVGVTAVTRRSFDQLNHQHTDAAVLQFSKEFARREADVAHQVQGIADAESTVRMAIDLSRRSSDVSIYVNDAHGVAQSHQLDFLDFVSADGKIVSSAEWSARFGYKLDWVTQAGRLGLRRIILDEGRYAGRAGARGHGCFHGSRRRQESLRRRRPAVGQGVSGLAGLADRDARVAVSESDGGIPAAESIDQFGPVTQADRFAPFIEEEKQHRASHDLRSSGPKTLPAPRNFTRFLCWGVTGDLLGVILVGNSQYEAVTLARRIRLLALGVVGIGICLGIFLSWWAAAGVTRPVLRLVAGARRVSEGDWKTRVPVNGRNEIGELARTFNHMTAQLSEQRERLVQAERVAAWREIARRLAHELEESFVSLADHRRELAAGQRQEPGTVRRSVPRIDSHPSLGNRRSEENRRPL